MKNKVLIGSIITTLLAFVLYSVNLHRMNNASIRVITPNSSKVIKGSNHAKKKEPKIGLVEYSNHVKTAKGSNQELAQAVKRAMGNDDNYQVAVQDLHRPKFARVANTVKVHQVTTPAKLLLLLAVYYQEQKGKFTTHTAIKVKKSDHVKGEKVLQTGLMYGVTYLRQALINGDRTAANVLMRKIGSKKVTAIVRKFGAAKTTVFVHDQRLRATTTAADLCQIMASLYQGKILKQQYANLLLGNLKLIKSKTKLITGVHADLYNIGDHNSAVVLVQSSDTAYCLAVWSKNNHNFRKLGQSISKIL